MRYVRSLNGYRLRYARDGDGGGGTRERRDGGGGLCDRELLLDAWREVYDCDGHHIQGQVGALT